MGFTLECHPGHWKSLYLLIVVIDPGQTHIKEAVMNERIQRL